MGHVLRIGLVLLLAGCATVHAADPAKEPLFQCEVERAKWKSERDTLNYLATSFLDTRTQVEKMLANAQAENAALREQMEALKKDLAHAKEKKR